jgi:hypothetical protein
MSSTCKQCGTELISPEGEPVDDSLCDSCRTDRHQRINKGRFIWLAVLIAYGTLIVVFGEKNSDKNYGWMFLNLALLNLFGFVATVVHEMGHAMTASMLRMKVHGMVVGSGPEIGQFQFLGFPVIFKLFALGGGHTVATLPTLHRARTKTTLFILAGPITNLLALIIVMWILGPDIVQANYPESTKLYPGLAFIGANLLAFAVNMYPRNVQTEFGTSASDGLNLLKTLTKKYDFTGSVEAHLLLSSREQLDKKDYSGARELAIEGVKLSTDKSTLRALLLSMAAWCDILIGQSQSFVEAKELATKSLELVPENYATKGTLGSALIELGNYQEGLGLLLESNLEVTNNQDRALNLSYVAIAYAGMGNQKQAKETLETIEKLDPGCLFLDRVRARII